MTRASRAAGAALLLLAGAAHAGGLARPIAGSPAAAGLAGAFGAIADDPTCLHANPAGCAFAAPSVLAALDFVVAPRSYVPVDADGARGPSQDATAIAPAPVLGALVRASDRVTVGVGAWNTFGGALHWEPLPDEDVPGGGVVNASTELVFELALGAAWAVDDRVALGATLRLGAGLFAVDATRKPVDTELSAFGVGVGASVGALVRLTDALAVGAGWRSPLTVTTTGSADLSPTVTESQDAEHRQTWPQAAYLALAWRVGARLTVAAQLDWTGWSRFETIEIAFPANPALDQVFPVDWHDTLSVRAGAQYVAGPSLVLRAGALFDGNAVPDRSLERQYLDADKFGLAAGASVALGRRAVLDLALSGIAGPARVVPDNAAELPPEWPELRNLAPGEHAGQVFTLSAGARFAL